MTAAEEVGPLSMRGVVMGEQCAVHTHRELVPLHVHHVWPSGHGGPDIPDNRVTVCANGHYSIHALLDWWLKTGGDVPWRVRIRYGRKVRALAVRGYESIRARQVAP